MIVLFKAYIYNGANKSAGNCSFIIQSSQGLNVVKDSSVLDTIINEKIIFSGF